MEMQGKTGRGLGEQKMRKNKSERDVTKTHGYLS